MGVSRDTKIISFILLLALLVIVFSSPASAKTIEKIMQEIREPFPAWTSQWNLDWHYLNEAPKLKSLYGGRPLQADEFNELCLKTMKAKNAQKFLDKRTGFKLFFNASLLVAKNSSGKIISCRKESISWLEKQVKKGFLKKTR